MNCKYFARKPIDHRSPCGACAKKEDQRLPVTASLRSAPTVHRQALIDRRLYLPESWARDAKRRAKGNVGALLGFKPKPKQAAFAARAFRCLPKSRGFTPAAPRPTP
jgi:SRSO17 transposase